MFDDFLVNNAKKGAKDNDEGNRALIGAIFEQAYQDAVSVMKCNDPDGARRFICNDNDLFKHYGCLLNFDPDWVAKGMRARLRMYDERKYRIKRGL